MFVKKKPEFIGLRFYKAHFRAIIDTLSTRLSFLLNTRDVKNIFLQQLISCRRGVI